MATDTSDIGDKDDRYSTLQHKNFSKPREPDCRGAGWQRRLPPHIQANIRDSQREHPNPDALAKPRTEPLPCHLGDGKKKEDLTHDEQLKLQLFERLTELKYPDVVEAREQIETLSREGYYAMVEKGVQRDLREKQRQEVLQKARREDREHVRAQMKRLAMVKAWEGMFEITLSSIKRLNEQEERAKAELNKIESRIARLKEEEKQAKANTDEDGLSESSSPEDS